MTNEEKSILLKDLCARLPYGVVCEYTFMDGRKTDMVFKGRHFDYEVICKPYLRPMESMTEEEKKEERKLWNIVTTTRNDLHYLYTDFLVSHHLDYRGLIPMGLALEAPEGMYTIK